MSGKTEFCVKCWDTPCSCPDQYNKLSPAQLYDIIVYGDRVIDDLKKINDKINEYIKQKEDAMKTKPNEVKKKEEVEMDKLNTQLQNEKVSHSAEPWSLEISGDSSWARINATQADITWLMLARVCIKVEGELSNVGILNAMRIVECVNAMEGIKNPTKWVKKAKKLMLESTDKNVDSDK